MSTSKHPSIDNRDSVSQTLGLSDSAKSRRPYLKWAGIALALLVAVWLLLQWRGSGNSQTLRYITEPVKQGNLTVTVTATGTLQPVNQVDVGSEISGTIRSVDVDYNDHVKKGQVLATMDTDQLQARVNQAQAALALAKAKVTESDATLKESRNQLRRAQELGKSGMNSQEDRDTAQATYERSVAALASSRAQVVQAQAALKAEQTTLEKATILSPINGIVLVRGVEPGQTVAASFQTPVLFTLAENLTQMELHVDVDEADVGQVKVGQQASFTVDAYPNKTFPAHITDVHYASQTVDGVVTYETVLRVDNSDLLLRPGMTATADIVVNKIMDAVLVPNAALRFSPPVSMTKKRSSGGLLRSILPHRPHREEKKREENTGKHQQVWVLENGQPQAVAVTAGATDGIMTQVSGDGIKPGMKIITDTSSSGGTR